MSGSRRICQFCHTLSQRKTRRNMLLCDVFATFATHLSLQMKREKKEVSLCHICYTFQPTMKSRKSCRMTFLPLLPHIPALFMTSLTLYCWAQNRSKDGCVFHALKRKSVINRIRSRAKTAHWCAFLWGGGGVAVAGVGVLPTELERLLAQWYRPIPEGRGGPAPFRYYVIPVSYRPSIPLHFGVHFSNTFPRVNLQCGY